jgi:hypothetical protein
MHVSLYDEMNDIWNRKSDKISDVFQCVLTLGVSKMREARNSSIKSRFELGWSEIADYFKHNHGSFISGVYSDFLVSLAGIRSEKFRSIIQVSSSLPGNTRDSSVSIALGYGLDDQGSRVRFRRGWEFFSYLMGTRGPFHGGKAAGAWNWPLTSI